VDVNALLKTIVRPASYSISQKTRVATSWVGVRVLLGVWCGVCLDFQTLQLALFRNKTTEHQGFWVLDGN
jgi:hypothetical protein